jgi:hypothetical protein
MADFCAISWKRRHLSSDVSGCFSCLWWCHKIWISGIQHSWVMKTHTSLYNFHCRDRWCGSLKATWGGKWGFEMQRWGFMITRSSPTRSPSLNIFVTVWDKLCFVEVMHRDTQLGRTCQWMELLLVWCSRHWKSVFFFLLSDSQWGCWSSYKLEGTLYVGHEHVWKYSLSWV